MRPCARCLSNAGLTDSAPHRRRNFRATAAAHQQTSSLPIATEVRPRCRRQGRTSDPPHRRRRHRRVERHPPPISTSRRHPRSRSRRRPLLPDRSRRRPLGRPLRRLLTRPARWTFPWLRGCDSSELRPRRRRLLPPRRRRRPARSTPTCQGVSSWEAAGQLLRRSQRRRRQRLRVLPPRLPLRLLPLRSLPRHRQEAAHSGCRAASSSTTRRRHPTNPESRAFYMWVCDEESGRRSEVPVVGQESAGPLGLYTCSEQTFKHRLRLRLGLVFRLFASPRLAPCVLRCSRVRPLALPRPSAVGRGVDLEGVTRQQFV